MLLCSMKTGLYHFDLLSSVTEKWQLPAEDGRFIATVFDALIDPIAVPQVGVLNPWYSVSSVAEWRPVLQGCSVAAERETKSESPGCSPQLPALQSYHQFSWWLVLGCPPLLSCELGVLHTPIMSLSPLSCCRGVIWVFPILPGGDSDVCSEHQETCRQKLEGIISAAQKTQKRHWKSQSYKLNVNTCLSELSALSIIGIFVLEAAQLCP